MPTEEWIQGLIPEISWSGDDGMDWNNFWIAVEKTKPIDKEEISNVNDFIDFENTIQSGEGEDNNKLNAVTKKWFWKNFILMDEISIILDPISGITTINIKEISYENVEQKLKERIRIKVKEEIKNYILYKVVKPNTLSPLYKKMIEFIAKSRHVGCTTKDIANEFGKEPKQIQHNLDHLKNLGLIVQHLIVKKGNVARNVLHIHYAKKNETYNLYNNINDCDDEGEDGEFMIKSATSDIVFNSESFKADLSNNLEKINQNILTFKDIYSRYEIDPKNFTLIKKIHRVISFLTKAGYMNRVNVIGENKKLLSAVKFVKPYKFEKIKPSEVTLNQFDFFPEIPVEQQVYKLIRDSKEKGILKMDICNKLMNISDRLVSNCLALLTGSNNNQSFPPCVNSWENDGRARMARIFTREAFKKRFDEKQGSINSNVPLNKGSIEIEKDANNLQADGSAQSNPNFKSNKVESNKNKPFSITMELRKNIVLQILKQYKAIKIDKELLRLIQAKWEESGEKYTIDQRTLIETINYLKANNLIASFKIKVLTIKGNTEEVELIHLPHIERDDPNLKKIIKSHSENVKYLLSTKKQLKLELFRDYKASEKNENNIQTEAEGEHVSSIKRLASLGKFNSRPKRFPNEIESANDSISSCFYHNDGQKLGFINSTLLRIKLLHLHIIELFEKTNLFYSQKRIIPLSFFCKDIWLQVLVSVISIKYPTSRLLEYCTQFENSEKSLSQIDEDIYNELIVKNKIFPKILDKLKLLEALELLIPLTNENIEEMKLTELMDPINNNFQLDYDTAYPTFYYLPDTFEPPAPQLDVMDNYSLKDLSACKLFWNDLELHSCAKVFQNCKEFEMKETNDLKLKEKQSNLKDILGYLKVRGNWKNTHIFTLEQKKILDSLVDFKRGLTPINDLETLKRYSEKFMVPCSILKAYFYKYEKKIKVKENYSQIRRNNKYVKIIKAAIKAKNNSNVLETDNLEPNPEKKDDLMNESENESENRTEISKGELKKEQLKSFLLAIAILTFRFGEDQNNWFGLLMKRFSNASLDSLKKRIDGYKTISSKQRKLKEYVEIWKKIYSKAIEDGTLKEIQDINKPKSKDDHDTESYLLRDSDVEYNNFKNQIRLFSEKVDEQPTKTKSLFNPLTIEVDELYENFNVLLSPKQRNYPYKMIHYFTPKIGNRTEPKNIMNYDMPSISLKTDRNISKYVQIAPGYKIEFLDIEKNFTKKFDELLNTSQFSNHNYFNLDDPSAALYLDPYSKNEQPDLGLDFKISHKFRVARSVVKMLLLFNQYKEDIKSSLSLLLSLSITDANNALESLLKAGVLAPPKLKELSSNQRSKTSGLDLRFVLSKRFLHSLDGSYPKAFTKKAREYYLDLISSPQKDKLNIIPASVSPGEMLAIFSMIHDNKIELRLTSSKSGGNLKNIKFSSSKFETGVAFSFYKEPSLKEISNQHVSRLKRENRDEARIKANRPVNKRSKIQSNIQPGEELESLLDSLSDIQIKQQVHSIYDFVDSFGVNGVSKSLLVCSCPDIEYEELKYCIKLLEKSSSPLIYQVGDDVPRYITHLYYKDWTIKPQVETEGINKELNILPKPWLDPKGQIHNKVYTTYQHAVLTAIFKSPGILKSALAHNMEFSLNRVELDSILESLLNKGAIYSHSFIQPSQPTLFSKRGITRELQSNLKSNLTYPFQITCYYPATDFFSRT